MIRMIIVMLALVMAPVLAFAHSGGTDADGCHTNRKTGEHHCHGKKSRSRADSSQQAPSGSSASGQSGSRIKHFHEAAYQKAWCSRNHGEAEVVLPDKTRADCITETHAIEFDFGQKWAEAIGQALYYSIQTGKEPGIVLILERESDTKYWIRLNTVIDHFGLKVKTWKMKPEDL